MRSNRHNIASAFVPIAARHRRADSAATRLDERGVQRVAVARPRAPAFERVRERAALLGGRVR